jgi:hypothetical protein
MAEYQQLNDPMSGGIATTVLRRADGATIPDDPANRDRAKYTQWLADGGVPDPASPIPPPTSITSVEYIARFTPTELLAIEVASHTDADVNYGHNLTLASDHIELGATTRSAVLTTWMDRLVAAGCITEVRKDQIMRLPESVTST